MSKEGNTFIIEGIDDGNAVFNGYYYYKDDLELMEEKTKENNMQLLDFNQLKEGITYRLLHGGSRDHGYNYELRNGILYNTSKRRNSTVPFSKSVKFIEASEKILTLSSLDYDVEFNVGSIKVGCQTISIDDAKELAFQILTRY